MNAEITHLSATVGAMLVQKGMHLSVAESCTGGLLGGALTEISGSSRYFRGGIIAYDNEIKDALLHVPQIILSQYGAVSKETVWYMAEGACRLFTTETAISISGIAGPEGGTDLKPVGLVWIGFSIQGNHFEIEHLFRGSREDVREQSVYAALSDFLRLLVKISSD